MLATDLTVTRSIARATLPPDDAVGAVLDGPPDPERSTSGGPTPRFSLRREVGRGGLGEVFVADDRDIGRQVAIKRVRIDHRSAAAVSRFAREVRTTGQLDHPNIVPIHDVGRDEDGTYYYVMKYLEGETLEGLIGRLRAGDAAAHAHWTFERRVALFRQIATAIWFAHQHGVIHRDIKPANIMVGAFDEVHVVDWGLAKRVRDPSGADGESDGPSDGHASNETRRGALVGTPLYMAPEQVRREPADERTDVWQLSLVFYELLTLSHYLDGIDDVPTMLDGVLQRKIPSPRSVRSPHQPPVPAELGDLVMRGLRRDPARRPTVAGLIAALDRRDEGEIDVVCPLTLQKWVLHRALRFVDQHPGLAWVSLLGTMSAAGAALFGSFGLVLLIGLVLGG